MMFGIWSRLIAAAVVAALLGGIYWRGHTQGYKARDTIAKADDAARVADALQASETARAREAELQTKVGKVDRAYQDQKRATVALAVAAADGMRHLEQQIAASRAVSAGPGDSSGTDADPRLDILAECSGALVRLDKEARKLADQVSALQAVAAIVRVK